MSQMGEIFRDSMRRPPNGKQFSEFSRLPLRLKAWRTEKGVKITSAAAELGVAASTWSHWESGRRFPSGSLLIELIRFTGIPVVEIFCENAHDCPFRKRKVGGR